VLFPEPNFLPPKVLKTQAEKRPRSRRPVHYKALVGKDLIVGERGCEGIGDSKILGMDCHNRHIDGDPSLVVCISIGHYWYAVPGEGVDSRPGSRRPTDGLLFLVWRRNMKTLRILIADDHELLRHGVRSLLQSHEGWEVCGEAADGRDAVHKAAQLNPDVVILDIGMPNLNGLDAARDILHDEPRTMILILTIDESEQVMREVLNAGARGFLLKSDAARDLVAAVEALQQHRTFFTSKVAEIVLDGYLKGKQPALRTEVPQERLTRREREVVQLLAEGKTTKEVASILGMSVKTAETHRSNIMRKLNLRSVSQLVLYAVRNNIVQVSPSVTAPASGERGS
jgi:DNA-binding NarL/FixJ family response regulator